jgi:co-chaperonin GroES (HSP10)
MTPLGYKILVQPDSKEEKRSEAGIIIVEDESKQVLKQGTIRAISPDIENPTVKVNDRILYEAGAGSEVLDGWLLMDYKSAAAII